MVIILQYRIPSRTLVTLQSLVIWLRSEETKNRVLIVKRRRKKKKKASPILLHVSLRRVLFFWTFGISSSVHQAVHVNLHVVYWGKQIRSICFLFNDGMGIFVHLLCSKVGTYFTYYIIQIYRPIHFFLLHILCIVIYKYEDVTVCHL